MTIGFYIRFNARFFWLLPNIGVRFGALHGVCLTWLGLEIGVVF